MNVVVSEDVKRAYPGLNLAFVEVHGLKIGSGNALLTDSIQDVSNSISKEITLETVKDRSDFRSYRDFFWKIGVDPTKTRPASEALVRRILKGSQSIPRINDFVDAYNISSIETGIPIAAFDLETIEEGIALRFSRHGEEFLGIGMQVGKPVGEGILVMSSGEDLIAIYPYRDAEQSKISFETLDAILISCGVPGIPLGSLIAAASRARDMVVSACGGHPTKIIEV